MKTAFIISSLLVSPPIPQTPPDTTHLKDQLDHIATQALQPQPLELTLEYFIAQEKAPDLLKTIQSTAESLGGSATPLPPYPTYQSILISIPENSLSQFLLQALHLPAPPSNLPPATSSFTIKLLFSKTP